ncbi:MAG TPA: tripartite tricarboxylate transporter substrate binding protein [Xanthobacteraceae bacterium]|nr:tripartite tricarboxylate transporter substrate binding protein [Xanthobacteraceae bacterium]
MRFLHRAAPIACLIALITAWPAANARADDAFPNRMVKIVVPAAAGSTTDTVARLLADKLARTWSQSVIVENIAGGAMNIGAERVAHAAPDGYTMLVCPPSPVSINQLLYRDIDYDPLKFTPVAMLAKIPNALVVRKDLPANSVGELIAYAKANPGKLTYGSQGVGSTAHLSASQMEVLAGIKMVHVPYRGALPALNDVIAGHIDMFFDTLTTSVPLWRAGKVRILAVASPERSPDVPDLPTIAESGLPGFRSITWFILVAPPGTPAAIAGKVNRDVNAAFGELGEKFRAIRLEPMPGTPADAARFIADETKLWGNVIKQAHITAQ